MDARLDAEGKERVDLLVTGRIVTRDEAGRVLAPGGVAIDKGRIVAVGSAAEITARYRGKHLDAGGNVVMPGMIDAHMHLYSAFARGMSIPGPPPTHFLEILDRLWWRLDRALTLEDLRYSALVGALQAIRCGTTLLFDHHASPNVVDGSLDVIAEALREVGLRGVLCYEVSDRDGPQIARAGIAENLRFIRKAQNDPLLRGVFGLHASFTLSEETLTACEEGKSAGFHIHVAEDAADQALAWHVSRKRVVERLHELGILGPRTIAAHGVHLHPCELALLAETGTFVVHNPESNMNNAVGAARIDHFIARGIPVGIGTDGMSANVFPASMTALLLARHTRRDPQAGWGEVETLLATNARLAGTFFDAPAGQITPGHLADLIVVDYDPPTPLTGENFVGHLLFGVLHARVTHTIVQGRVVLEDGRAVHVDEAEIHAKAREAAAALWKRLES